MSVSILSSTGVGCEEYDFSPRGSACLFGRRRKGKRACIGIRIIWMDALVFMATEVDLLLLHWASLLVHCL